MSPAVPTAPIAPLSLTRSDGGVLTLDGSRCVIMGILNLTPDSFSDGGRLTDVTAALRHAERLVAEGAAILDFGAESTRPGARLLSVDEEWQRLRPVVQALPTLQLPAVLSIDTRHAETARRVHELGFRLLNLAFPQHLFSQALDDPQAAALDRPARHALLGGFDGIVVMHSRGTPASMRELTDYDGDLCETVPRYFRASSTIPAWALPRLPSRASRCCTTRLLCGAVWPGRSSSEPHASRCGAR